MAISRKSIPKSAGTKERIKKVIDRLEKTHPDAKLDLNFSNPLELLIALILAAQARDDLVNKITVELFKKYRTAEDYARTTQPQLEKDIGKINFYRNKARAIRNCCKEIVERFGGKVPDKLDDLISLPGVGRKTANIVLGNTRNTDPDKIEFDLMPIVLEKKRVRFCHLLQYHGRRVCVAKKPRCPDCTIRSLCPYPDKTTA